MERAEAAPAGPSAGQGADGEARRAGRRAPLTSFVGRAGEVAAVVDLLRTGHRLVTITGPGGVGKTRLAVAIAAELGRSAVFPDGDVFVGLAPVADEALVIPTIARALGIVAEDDRPPAARLATALEGRHLLLTVDNVEHLVGAAPELAALLEAAPDSTILATSRRALRLAGEQEFPLTPLPVPNARHSPSVAELAATPAVTLFLDRATAARPTFTLNDENAVAVAEVCARLDGLPLAIELAAARTKVLSPQALAARLTGRLQVLTAGPRDLPRRQQTLRDAIAWSYDLLSPEEQALFRRLAVFAGGATLEAIEAVASGEWGVRSEKKGRSAHSPLPASPSALDSVQALVEHSLLVQEEGPAGESRFRMLETIREFALDRLVTESEAEAVRDAHAAFVLDLAERSAAREYGREEVAAFQRLEPELDNVRAALTWLLDGQEVGSGRARLGLRLAGAMVRFWDIRGYLAEEADWLNLALARVPAEPTRERAFALTALGVNAWFTGDLDGAVAHQERALAIWRGLNDPLAMVRSLWLLGLVAGKRQEVTRLEELSAEAAPLAVGLEVTLWKVVPDSLVAMAALARGDGPGVVAALEPTLAYHERHDYLWPHAWVLGILAEAAMLEGDRPRSLALHQRSLAEFAEAGDVYAMLDGLSVIAVHATGFGQAETAARLLGAILAVRPIVGVRVTWASISEDATTEIVRAALGAAAFEAVRAEGRSLPLTEAVELALAVTPVAPAGKPAAAPGAIPFGLSPREFEVLRLLAAGKSNQEIGDALFISHRTAGTHVANIFGKLGVGSRAAAVAFAHAEGLLDWSV